MGATGALLLIFSGQQVQNASLSGNIWGDLLCLFAQFCFACYLVFYKGLNLCFRLHDTIFVQRTGKNRLDGYGL